MLSSFSNTWVSPEGLRSLGSKWSSPVSLNGLARQCPQLSSSEHLAFDSNIPYLWLVYTSPERRAAMEFSTSGVVLKLSSALRYSVVLRP